MIDIKTRYSAFYKTDLEDHLRSLGITDLIICGIMTNYCCETTARDGFNQDFRIFFLADATATDDPALHQATYVTWPLDSPPSTPRQRAFRAYLKSSR